MTGGGVRRGRRWTELDAGDQDGADAIARTERTRRAAASRRAAAARRDRRGRRLMSILRLAGVTREIGAFAILDSIDAAIALGDRIGLVGPNGAGKTTLLRIAAGGDEPDRGDGLAQARPVDRAARAGGAPRRGVHGRPGPADGRSRAVPRTSRRWRPSWPRSSAAGRVTEPAYADLQHRFDALGGYTLDQRVDEALTGLGFAPDEWAKPPTALSGGEQTRAALARLVIADPDLLLLDEPTNHLDLDALEWLEEHLRRRTGSLLVASHDRAFLDATVTRVWELRDRRLTAFRGDYSAYHRQREERDARAVKDAETQADQIERERELVQRYRSHRKFTKMHEHEARLERLQAERRGGAQSGPPADAAADGARRRGTGPLRRDRRPRRGGRGRLSARPRRGRRRRPPGDRAAPGRSRAVPGGPARRPDRHRRTQRRRQDHAPAHDRRRAAAARRRAQLRQRRPDRLPRPAARRRHRRARPCSTRCSATIPVTPGEARSYLARFLFRGDDVFKEVRMLSGGERSRLELALLGIQPSNLLLLDEPTNHLDIPAREAIEAFMRESPATLLVVSHDRRLLETVCDRLWVVDDGLAVAVRRRLPGVAGRGRRWLDDERRGRSAPVRDHGRRPAASARRGRRRRRRARPRRREPRGCRRTRIAGRSRRSTPS